MSVGMVRFANWSARPLGEGRFSRHARIVILAARSHPLQRVGVGGRHEFPGKAPKNTPALPLYPIVPTDQEYAPPQIGLDAGGPAWENPTPPLSTPGPGCMMMQASFASVTRLGRFGRRSAAAILLCLGLSGCASTATDASSGKPPENALGDQCRHYRQTDSDMPAAAVSPQGAANREGPGCSVTTMPPAADDLFQRVCQYVRQTAVWTAVEAALGWDERTQLPPAGGDYRAEQLTAISGLLHRRWTDPQFVADVAANWPQGPLLPRRLLATRP